MKVLDTRYLLLVIFFQAQFYRGICQSEWGYQSFIHRFWPSQRVSEANSTDPMPMFHREENQTMKPSGSSKTLVYGSPICIGRCLILQIFWSNSSTSFLGVKLPKIPTFPKPRLVSKSS